jgi:hypothetical protein
MVQRILNHRDTYKPIDIETGSLNYYPVQSDIYIEDINTHR